MRGRSKKKSSSPKKTAAKKSASKLKKIVRKIRSKIVRKPVVAPLQRAAGTEAPAPWVDDRLPAHYGEDALVLLVRDPWWLYAYWEITSGRQRQVEREMEKSGLRHRKTVLRMYDVTGSSLPAFHSFFDVELNFFTDNWYVDVGIPDREWIAEIGFRAEGGRFFPLVRSNRVRTPSFGISEVLDEEWMLPEDIYFRLIGRSIGIGSAGDSMDVRKMLQKYLRSVVSSEHSPEYSKKASV
jgi:uncharacterized protein